VKSNPATHFIPVVIVTALDSPSDRVRGWKPPDDFSPSRYPTSS